MMALGMAGALRAADKGGRAVEQVPPPEAWQIAGVRAALQDPSPVVRANAILQSKDWDWKVLGLQAAEVLPLFREGENEVRMGALYGLRQLGPEAAADHARALVPLLVGNPGDGLRLTARRILKDLGRYGVGLVMKEITPNLMSAGRATQEQVLEVMLECGRDAAPFARPLLPLLQSREVEVRVKALQVLGGMQLSESDPHATPHVVRELLQLLHDPQSRVRAAAAHALRHAGAQDAIPVGLSLQLPLFDKDKEVRSSAIWALGGLDATAAHLGISKLLPLLDDPDPDIRSLAIDSLASLGKVAANSVAASLGLLLKDDIDVVELRDDPLLPESGLDNEEPPLPAPVLLHQSASVRKRHAALNVLAQMGDEAIPYARMVRPLLGSSEPEMRAAAVMTLWQIGRGTSIYLKELLPMVQDADPEVRHSAVFALSGMEPEDTAVLVRAVLPLLKTTDVKMISAVAQVFWSMRVLAATMHAEVLPAFREASPAMQLELMRVLAPAGADAVPYMQAMQPLLQGPDLHAKRRLTEALGSMGPAAAAFAKDLLTLLHDPDKEVRTAAVIAFRQMGTAAAPYAGDLLKKTEDADKGVQQLAFQAMAKMGPQAAPVLAPALLALFQQGRHPWNDVRDAVDACGNFKSDPAWQCAALALALKEGVREVEVQRLRSHLYLWSGRDAGLLLSVRWLGRPAAYPMSEKGLSVAEQQALLGMLLRLWPASAPHPALRREIAARMGDVARGITTLPDKQVAALLVQAEAQLKTDAVKDSKVDSAKECAAVQGALARMER